MKTRSLPSVPTAHATMQAAVLQQARRSVRATESVPEIEARQVLVRVQGCGVCGSSLPLWQGRPWFQYPLRPGAPGHEGWGVIEAVGSEVHEPAVGDRVAMLSQHAFAEWDVVDAEATVTLPPDLDDQPFPGEALGCAINVLHRSGITAESTVVIIGIGFLGAVLTQLATAHGARVFAVSRRPFSQETARQCGAEDAFSFADAQAKLQHVIGSADMVIEATGHQSALDLASQIISTHGRMVIAGYHQDGLRDINMQQWNWKGIDVINAHERDQETQVRGMREAVKAILDGRIDPSRLYTHRFTLDQLDTAFEHLEQRPDDFVKALVVNG